ncbi:MAG: GspH/FimT family pseudopilin [Tatlockia sp.]|nr:GspH/FimT family pseudopilin [Tatlockia sp.]
MLKNCGLSLLELVAGLVILSILFFFCLPLGLSIYRNNQVEIIKNEISAAVQFARTTAALRGLPLILTPLPQSSDWSAGMILFVDNERHQYSEKTELIHQWQWNYQGIRINWQGLYSKNYLLFAAEQKHAAASGHFIIQHVQGKSLKITLNRLGRVRAAQPFS